MRRGGLHPSDLAVVAYAVYSGILVAIGAPPGWPALLALRAALLAGVVALTRLERRAGARTADLLAVRVAYPLVVCPLFFWEAPRLAEALWGSRAWWFETTLSGWDRALIGGPSIPATFDVPIPVGEVLWMLYFAYYPLVLLGLALAWPGLGNEGGSRPSRRFEPVLTASVIGFLAAYALFPLLPARAPIHVLDAVPGATGGLFGSAVGWVQGWGGVTGGTFPSAHVSAAWAIVVGLAPERPRASAALGLVAAGMTVACVYTPYHWAADVAAGLVLGVTAGVAGRRLTGPRRPDGRAAPTRAPDGS